MISIRKVKIGLSILLVMGIFTIGLLISLESPKTNNDRGVQGSSVTVSVSHTGATLTQYSLDDFGDTAAIASGKALLDNSTEIVNQHILGFGTVSPVTSEANFDSDTYDWSSQDDRFNVVMSGAGTKVLTACCAPNWIKGTPSDFGSDGMGGDYIEYAPLVAYYDDYATIVAKAVQRYPSIEYVQVWNEMKGFWNSSLNRWNYEDYTTLYNKVYNAVKAVRPSVKVGGPYVVVGSNGNSHSYNSSTLYGSWGWVDKRDMDVLTYWLANKTGADFIALDIKNKNRDGTELVDIYTRMDKFQAVADWVRSLSGTTGLPIWWSEWYSRTDSNSDPADYKNSAMAVGLIKNVKAGIYTSLMWAPQGDTSGNSQPLALFTDTRVSGGGVATLFHATQKYINDNFSAGTTIQDISPTNSNIEVLVSDKKLLAVNKTNSAQTDTVAGVDVSLASYQVSLYDLPSPPSSGGGSTGGSSGGGSSSGGSTSTPTSSSSGSPAKSTNTGSTTANNSTPEADKKTNPILDNPVVNNPVTKTAQKAVGALVSDSSVKVAGKHFSTQPVKIGAIILVIGSIGALTFIRYKFPRKFASYLDDPDIMGMNRHLGF